MFNSQTPAPALPYVAIRELKSIRQAPARGASMAETNAHSARAIKDSALYRAGIRRGILR